MIIKRALSFMMSASRFVNVSEKVINAMEQNLLRRAQIILLSLAVPFSKEMYDFFWWLNKINLLKLLAYLHTTIHHNCNKICVMLTLSTENTTEFESTWVITKNTKKKIRLRFSEHCWIIPSTSSRGLFNNIHFAFGEL